MEFDNLPSAYDQAVSIANQAAAGDPSWQGLVDHLQRAEDSFAHVQAGAGSDADFSRFQNDTSVLNADCTALNRPLLDD